jgi:hypothetical protein
MWNDWSPATCLPDHCFCEALHEGALRQPANSWSSLAFCGAGVVRALELMRGPSARFSQLQSACLAAAAIFLGATSAFYHASLSFLGQWLDVESMYLLALVGFAANVDALRPQAPKRFLPLYVGLNVVMGVLLLTVPVLRRYAFAGAILAIIVTEVLLRRQKLRDWSLRPLHAAIGLMAVAFSIWILDLTKTVCAPHSWLQGHAVWHVLGACATYALWRYYRGPQTA